MSGKLRVVIIKPSKYTKRGYVERFRWGFMPNSTLLHIKSMTPACLGETPVEVCTIDEYVHTDLQYLSLLKSEKATKTLVAFVGVQSHQFHRALDLAAYASRNGCMAIIGGPHPMTCDTSDLHGRGISFALAESELIWPSVLNDAISGSLKPLYGGEQRWQRSLDAPVIIPPSRKDLGRYIVPLLGLYPARGCPFTCNFCSVIKISGRRIRSQSLETTMASLRAAKAAGVRMIMFTSDNFNKYPEANDLLSAMIEEKINIPFIVQCDTQLAKQEDFIGLLAEAGCLEVFLGVESFSREALLSVRKYQNRPDSYKNIVTACRKNGINSHFSNIIGFPQDTRQSIRHHMDSLIEIDPTWASFYVLCPIPGTDQYEEFLSAGLISERNLDRFDTICLTWKHPLFSADELDDILYNCYSRFYSLKHTVMNWRRLKFRNRNYVSRTITHVGFSLFHRYSALKKVHPMSGGIKRVVVDSVDDYRMLRRNTFGFDLAPLPRNLRLPEADERYNHNLKSSLRR